MDPSAVRDLLLNLKLQLLALPGYARWGVLAFAGIIVLREGITLVWNARQRRQALTGGNATEPTGPAISPGVSQPLNRLPAPDPFGAQAPPVEAPAIEVPRQRSLP